MKKLAILIILLLPTFLFGQESQPTDTLSYHGITIDTTGYDLPVPSDFSTIIYIDPDATTDGTGTYSSPWNSLASHGTYDSGDGAWEFNTSDIAYLVKNGTYLNENSSKVYFNADNTMIGSYGTGNRAKLRFFVCNMYGDNIAYRDVHLYEFNVKMGIQGTYTDGVTVYNCEIERETSSSFCGLKVYSANTFIIGNVIHGMKEDGIFIQGADGASVTDAEVAYNFIYDINQNWFDATESYAVGGDCLQFSSVVSYYAHNNVMDRRKTGNKFVFYARDESETIDTVFGVIEYNVMYAPNKSTSAYGTTYNSNVMSFKSNTNLTIRYNKFIGESGNSYSNTHLYFDGDVQDNIHIYSNEFWYGAKPFYLYDDMKVYNNTWYGQTSYPATGTKESDYIVNNVFSNTFTTTLTNTFIDQTGTSIFNSPPDDLSPGVSSSLRDAATWYSWMDTDFTEDINGTSITQSTGNFDVGALMYDDGSTDICDGVTITYSTSFTPDTNDAGIATLTISSAAGGTNPYDYSVIYGSTEVSTSAYTDSLSAGSYTVEVSDDNGCSSNSSFTITNISTASYDTILVDSVTTQDYYQDPNIPANANDRDESTRLSTDEIFAGFTFHCNTTSYVEVMKLALLSYDRLNYFAYECYYNGGTGGIIYDTTTLDQGYYEVEVNQIADSVIFYTNGNSTNDWFSLTELYLFGYDYSEPTALGSTTQINFSSGTVTDWTSLNQTTTSATVNDHVVTVSGSGTMSIWSSGTDNGIWPTDVNTYAIVNDGSGGYLSITSTNMPTVIDTLEIFMGVSNGVYQNLYIEGTLTESNYAAISNTDMLTYTDVVNDGTLNIDIYEENSLDKAIINAMRFVSNAEDVSCDATNFVVSSTVTDESCYFWNNGSIVINSVTGGTSPYTYAWSTGETIDSITSKYAGYYSVVITDDNGCDTTITYQITEPSNFSTDFIDAASPTCYGGIDGSLTVSVSDATPSYVLDSINVNGTYTNKNQAFTDTIIADNLEAGSIVLYISDANGCELGYSTTLDSPDPIIISADTTNAVNNENGALDLTASGGTQPYTYLWSNGETTQDIGSLSAGTYSVIVTDDNLCTAYDTFLITSLGCGTIEYQLRSVDWPLNNDYPLYDYEGGVGGIIDINTDSISGGTAPYTYTYSDGFAGAYYDDLDSGYYNLQIEDANGCILHDTLYVAHAWTSPPYQSTFESGMLFPERGELGYNNQYGGSIEVVENPNKDAYNSSDYVLISKSPAHDTLYTRAEYKVHSTNSLETSDKRHIYKYSMYVDDTYLDVDEVWQNWWTITQWKTWPCQKYGDGTYTDSIAYTGGIFNDLIYNAWSSPKQHEFRFRAKPDSALIEFPINYNAWNDIVYEIFWTTADSGYYNVFLNDVVIAHQDTVQTLMDGFSEEDCGVRFDLGLYVAWRDSTSVDSQYMYFDDIEIYVDSTLESVAYEAYEALEAYLAADSLIAYLPLNGSSADSSGTGNDGVWSGTETYGYNFLGEEDGAAVFDGSSNITAPLTQISDSTNDFAIALWFNSSATSSNYLFSSESSNLYVRQNTATQFLTRHINCDPGLLYYNTDETIDGWNLLTFSYSNDSLVFALNDSIYDKVEVIGNVALTEIGIADGIGGEFIGSQCEFKVFDKALTESQIASNFVEYMDEWAIKTPTIRSDTTSYELIAVDLQSSWLGSYDSVRWSSEDLTGSFTNSDSDTATYTPTEYESGTATATYYWNGESIEETAAMSFIDPSAIVDIEVTITHTNPTSLLGTDGTLSLSISNGTPDYVYLLTWQNETVVAFGTSSSGEVAITGLKEGRYRLSVTDEDESTTSFYSDNVRIYTPFGINKDGTVAFDAEGNLIFNN